MPVPASETLAEVLDASLVMVTVALKVPAALGENEKLSFALCPAAIERGRAGLVREKDLVEIEAALIVIEALPEFVAVRVKVLLLPAATLPKSRLTLERERVPSGA